MQNKSALVLTSLIIGLCLVACGSQVEITPSVTSTFDPTISPTIRPTSTSTLMPSPSPTETETQTPTPTPSPTPTPTIVVSTLRGKLFFDMNGNGLQDVAYYQDDNDSIVSKSEEGLSGFEVCTEVEEKEHCEFTNENGEYEIANLPIVNGETVNLKITNPRNVDSAQAMRFINKWKGTVVIPAYEIDGIQIPEQKLNDTAIFPIESAVAVEVGNENDLGLMQGYFTLPFHCDQNFTLFNYFDLDDGAGVRNYLGETTEFAPNYIVGTSDGHPGVDYKISIGEFLYAFMSGQIINGDNGRGAMYVDISNSVMFYNAHIGHVSKYTVENQSSVYRGQIIALSGTSGTNWAHVHMQYGFGNKDLFRDTLSNESLSYWTVDNLPICMKSNE